MKYLITSLLIGFALNTHAQVLVEEVGQLPEPVSNNAVCEGFVNDTPYVFSFAGIDTSKNYSGIHLKSFRYNTITGQSSAIPSLPDTLGKIAAAASRIGNIIYISGGYHVFSDGHELSSSKMHRYDIANNVFLTDGQDIPVATDDHVQAVWKDSLIYLITGWSNTTNIPDVQIYNPTSDSWLSGTSVPNQNSYKSFGASGTIIGDTIYYFGGASSGWGFNIQNQMRKGVINPTDPTQIDWSISIPDPAINGYRMAATQVGDSLYWIGGSNVTYNYNGIAYNGSGGVPPANRMVYTAPDSLEWHEVTVDEIPMDLRGIAKVNNNVRYIMGGMNAMQTVTDKVYKLTFEHGTPSETGELMPNAIELYPNPFGDQLHITTPHGQTARINIYTLMGRQVLHQVNTASSVHIPTAFLPNGIYLIEVQTPQHTFTKKMIKSS